MARYRMYAFWRVQILAMFAVFAVVAVILATVATRGGNGPPIAFVAVWIAALVWNGYWFLFRIVYDLELEAGQLRWRTPLKSGVEDLGDVIELRPSRFGSNVEVVELADGRRLVVIVRKGFKAFTEVLVAARPDLAVRLGFHARWVEKLPGWSGYRGLSAGGPDPAPVGPWVAPSGEGWYLPDPGWPPPTLPPWSEQPGYGPSGPPSPWRRSAWVVAGIAGLLAAVVAAVTVYVIARPSPSRGISGAAGYSTYSGPHGLPLELGEPWGKRCQPVVIVADSAVPEPVYQQILSAVLEARGDGIDITATNPAGKWYANSVYPPGQTQGTVQFVPITASSGAPTLNALGGRDRIELGWDGRVAPDDRHEFLKYLQATIWLRTVQSNPEQTRLATRRVIAYSQGVSGTPPVGSGIAFNSTVDTFTKADLAAMELMSGCDYQTAPPMPTFPVPPSETPTP